MSFLYSHILESETFFLKKNRSNIEPFESTHVDKYMPIATN